MVAAISPSPTTKFTFLGGFKKGYQNVKDSIVTLDSIRTDIHRKRATLRTL
jgi:hypothetical protein